MGYNVTNQEPLKSVDFTTAAPSAKAAPLAEVAGHLAARESVHIDPKTLPNVITPGAPPPPSAATPKEIELDGAAKANEIVHVALPAAVNGASTTSQASETRAPAPVLIAAPSVDTVDSDPILQQDAPLISPAVNNAERTAEAAASFFEE